MEERGREGGRETLQQSLSLSITVGTLQCFSPADECATDLPPLPCSQLPLVVSRYNEAIARLEVDGDRMLAACAMHELGNVHHHTGSVK